MFCSRMLSRFAFFSRLSEYPLTRFGNIYCYIRRLVGALLMSLCAGLYLRPLYDIVYDPVHDSNYDLVSDMSLLLACMHSSILLIITAYACPCGSTARSSAYSNGQFAAT